MTGLGILWLLIGPQWSQLVFFSVRSVNSASLWLVSVLFVQVNLEQFNPSQSLIFCQSDATWNQTTAQENAARPTPRRYYHCFARRCQGQGNYRCNAVLMAPLSSDGSAFYPTTSLAFTGFPVDVWNAFRVLRLLKSGWRGCWPAVSLPLSFDNRTGCFCGELRTNGTNKLLKSSRVVG